MTTRTAPPKARINYTAKEKAMICQKCILSECKPRAKSCALKPYRTH